MYKVLKTINDKIDKFIDKTVFEVWIEKYFFNLFTLWGVALIVVIIIICIANVMTKI